MGWIILGVVVVALLAIAVLVDLKDRSRGGKRIAGGLGEARRTDIAPDPHLGDQNGTFLP